MSFNINSAYPTTSNGSSRICLSVRNIRGSILSVSAELWPSFGYMKTLAGEDPRNDSNATEIVVASSELRRHRRSAARAVLWAGR